MSFTLNLLMINCSHPRGADPAGGLGGLGAGEVRLWFDKIAARICLTRSKTPRNASTWATHRLVFFFQHLQLVVCRILLLLCNNSESL